MEERGAFSLAGTSATPAIVVMGVAGCGKTVLGQALAEKLGYRFVEGDALHPPENVARMAEGLPLTDELRAGWLDAIGQAIADAGQQGEGVVAACSALRRRYRDQLGGWHAKLVFLHLVIDKQTARERVAHRRGHFMPASLVDSQFSTLELPEADENALALDGTHPIHELVGTAASILATLRSTA